MFNLPTGGEFLIILLVALVVLGPEKLPDFVRKAGQWYGEVRRMATGFTSELKDALDEPQGGLQEMKAGFTDPLRVVRETMESARSTFIEATRPPVIEPGQRIQQASETPPVPAPVDDTAPAAAGEPPAPVPAEETATPPAGDALLGTATVNTNGSARTAEPMALPPDAQAGAAGGEPAPELELELPGEDVTAIVGDEGDEGDEGDGEDGLVELQGPPPDQG